MPFVKTIILDEVEGSQIRTQSIPYEDPERAAALIRLLDGIKHTQIIYRGEGRSLIVGGGNHSIYSVALTVGEDERFYTLLDPSARKDRTVVLVAGGQAGSYPAEQGVTERLATEAIEEFIQTGEPSNTLVLATGID